MRTVSLKRLSKRILKSWLQSLSCRLLSLQDQELNASSAYPRLDLDRPYQRMTWCRIRDLSSLLRYQLSSICKNHLLILNNLESLNHILFLYYIIEITIKISSKKRKFLEKLNVY